MPLNGLADLNEAFGELAEYYITDVKPIGEGLIAILYFSRKKSYEKGED